MKRKTTPMKGKVEGSYGSKADLRLDPMGMFQGRVRLSFEYAEWMRFVIMIETIQFRPIIERFLKVLLFKKVIDWLIGWSIEVRSLLRKVVSPLLPKPMGKIKVWLLSAATLREWFTTYLGGARLFEPLVLFEKTRAPHRVNSPATPRMLLI